MKDIDQRTYGLLFDIQRSVRYHTHQRAFFEHWNQITSALTVIGASSVLTLWLADKPWSPWVVAFIGLFAVLDIAIGTARRANDHTSIAQQFIMLEQQFSHGRSLEDAEYEAIARRYLEIELAEPPVKDLLNLLCDLEVRRVHGNQVQNPAIPWWRRLSANWLSQMKFAQQIIDNLARPEMAGGHNA